MRILLAEDDAHLASLIRTTLTAAGAGYNNVVQAKGTQSFGFCATR